MEKIKRDYEHGIPTMEQMKKVRNLFNIIYPQQEGYIENHSEKEEEIIKFLELGFTPYFSFYGENNELKPSISWYGFYGNRGKDYLNLVICSNINKGEFTVYKDSKKIGIFNELGDIVELFKIREYDSKIISVYEELLLFNSDKLGKILKRAKKLMEDEKWNEDVEKAVRLNKEDSYTRNNSIPLSILENFILKDNKNLEKGESKK